MYKPSTTAALVSAFCMASLTVDAIAQAPSFECHPPVLIGSIADLDNPTNITIFEEHAYIIEDDRSLAIIDLTNPEAPQLVGRLDRVYGGTPLAVTVHNDAAYLSTDDGILVINIEDKADPWFFRKHSMVLNAYDSPIPTANGYMYVNEAAGLSLARPMSPAFDPFLTTGLPSTPALIDDNELITRDRSRYDISSPLQPILTHQGPGPNLDYDSRYDAPYIFSFDTNSFEITRNNIPRPDLVTHAYESISMNDATIRSEIIYAANGSLDLYAIDTIPYLIASFGPNDGMINANLVRQHGDHFVVISNDELAIYDIPSNPLAGVNSESADEYLAKIGNTLISVGTNANSNSMACTVIDIDKPRRPRWIAQLPFSTPNPAPSGVAVHESTVYVAEYFTGINAYDLTDPQNPIPLGTYATNSPPRDIQTQSGFAYAIDATTGLYSFTIEPDSSLTPIGTLPIEDALRHLTLMGDLALISSDAVAYLVDISDPQNPTYLSTILGKSFRSPSIPTAHREGNLLYTAENSMGYRIFDISDPTHPIELAQFDADLTTPKGKFDAYVHDILIENNNLYVSMSSGGFAIYDNANPFAPVLRSHTPTQPLPISTDARYRQFIKDSNNLYIASASGGVRVLSLNGCALPCAIDYNQDGALNFFDVTAFIVAFNAADPIADLNPDGQFNFFDIAEFLIRYQGGCP